MTSWPRKARHIDTSYPSQATRKAGIELAKQQGKGLDWVAECNAEKVAKDLEKVCLCPKLSRSLVSVAPGSNVSGRSCALFIPNFLGLFFRTRFRRLLLLLPALDGCQASPDTAARLSAFTLSQVSQRTRELPSALRCDSIQAI
jgi:hypothetical protein